MEVWCIVCYSYSIDRNGLCVLTSICNYIYVCDADRRRAYSDNARSYIYIGFE